VQQVVLNLVLDAVEAMGSVDAGARELVISIDAVPKVACASGCGTPARG
jgi:hypothetical protein